MNNTNTALLVVDMQRGFMNPRIGSLRKRIEKLQKDYACVIITRFVSSPGSPIPTKLDPSGSELAFRPLEQAHIITKTTYGALNEEMLALLESLQNQGRAGNINRVHIAGIDTEACVLKTALDFFDAQEHLGIQPIVLANYCQSTTSEEHHQAALIVLRQTIGEESVQVLDKNRNPT